MNHHFKRFSVMVKVLKQSLLPPVELLVVPSLYTVFLLLSLLFVFLAPVLGMSFLLLGTDFNIYVFNLEMFKLKGRTLESIVDYNVVPTSAV